MHKKLYARLHARSSPARTVQEKSYTSYALVLFNVGFRLAAE